MGNVWQKLQKRFYNKEVRILMIGLDAAGKTSTLYRLKLGEIVTTIPTIGFNVETITYKNVNFTAWDVGGRDKIRPLYRHYFQNTGVVILVVDSNDRERISESKDELWRLFPEDELKSAIFLVMANKQDLPNAMSVQEVTEKLELNKIRDREWYIQGTCAMTGEGLYEGLSWIQSTLTKKEVKRAVEKPVKEVVASVIPEGVSTSSIQVDRPADKPNVSSWWNMITSYFAKTTIAS